MEATDGRLPTYDQVFSRLGFWFDEKESGPRQLVYRRGERGTGDKFIVSKLHGNSWKQIRGPLTGENRSGSDVIALIWAFAHELGITKMSEIPYVAASICNTPLNERFSNSQRTTQSTRAFDPKEYLSEPISTIRADHRQILSFLISNRAMDRETLEMMSPFVLATKHKNPDGYHHAYSPANVGFPMYRFNKAGVLESEICGYELKNLNQKYQAIGSDTVNGFWYATQAKLHAVRNIYFFESALDAMSFVALKKNGFDINRDMVVSTSGEPKKAQIEAIRNACIIAKPYACFDKDPAGIRDALLLNDYWTGQGMNITINSGRTHVEKDLNHPNKMRAAISKLVQGGLHIYGEDARNFLLKFPQDRIQVQKGNKQILLKVGDDVFKALCRDFPKAKAAVTILKPQSGRVHKITNGISRLEYIKDWNDELIASRYLQSDYDLQMRYQLTDKTFNEKLYSVSPLRIDSEKITTPVALLKKDFGIEGEDLAKIAPGLSVVTERKKEEAAKLAKQLKQVGFEDAPKNKGAIPNLAIELKHAGSGTLAGYAWTGAKTKNDDTFNGYAATTDSVNGHWLYTGAKNLNKVERVFFFDTMREMLACYGLDCNRRTDNPRGEKRFDFDFKKDAFVVFGMMPNLKQVHSLKQQMPNATPISCCNRSTYGNLRDMMINTYWSGQQAGFAMYEDVDRIVLQKEDLGEEEGKTKMVSLLRDQYAITHQNLFTAELCKQIPMVAVRMGDKRSSFFLQEASLARMANSLPGYRIELQVCKPNGVIIAKDKDKDQGVRLPMTWQEALAGEREYRRVVAREAAERLAARKAPETPAETKQPENKSEKAQTVKQTAAAKPVSNIRSTARFIGTVVNQSQNGFITIRTNGANIDASRPKDDMLEYRIWKEDWPKDLTANRGDLITFSLDGEKVQKVQPVQGTEQDLQLALNYRGRFSRIRVTDTGEKNSVRHVLRRISMQYISQQGGGEQGLAAASQVIGDWYQGLKPSAAAVAWKDLISDEKTASLLCGMALQGPALQPERRTWDAKMDTLLKERIPQSLGDIHTLVLYDKKGYDLTPYRDQIGAIVEQRNETYTPEAQALLDKLEIGKQATAEQGSSLSRNRS